MQYFHERLNLMDKISKIYKSWPTSAKSWVRFFCAFHCYFSVVGQETLLLQVLSIKMDSGFAMMLFDAISRNNRTFPSHKKTKT